MGVMIFLGFWLACMLCPEDVVDMGAQLCRVVRFFFMVLRVALSALADALWFVIRHLVRLLWRAAAWAALLLVYFAIELARGPDKAEEEDEFDADPDEAELIEAARTLLGLPERYTGAMLDAAYKQAIRKAHPDAGGSVNAAQAVNLARDLLLRRLGAAA